ncbi:hypothetical protein BSLG_007578 [Batrachochytrium salamandrivorans]|nr:hypothetical protein BSLG_007578 [Batrachochytrium salamandrivorans]
MGYKLNAGSYDTQDGLFDCAWSEIHENQLVTSSGDGSLKLWDLTMPDFPVMNWTEHKREVFSVNWNLVRKDTFVTGSWDYTIKLWNPEAPNSIHTWQEHTGCIYQTTWSPSHADIFASVGDQTAKIWDVRLPRSVQSIHAHNAEVLALDWGKYQKDTIVTGSVDSTVRVWDLRYPQKAIAVLAGHEYAVRRVKCSPHQGNIIGSASYDMTARFWDWGQHQNGGMYQHTMYTMITKHTNIPIKNDTLAATFPEYLMAVGWSSCMEMQSIIPPTAAKHRLSRNGVKYACKATPPMTTPRGSARPLISVHQRTLVGDPVAAYRGMATAIPSGILCNIIATAN